mmetsp:Transcript_23171/g.35241  ORF Transcript_23171/g.35241 Transcript_23171/m.35241 type:complete len:444 (-) Transcript_23171:183-1514(-)
MILYGFILSATFFLTILSGVAGTLEPSSAPSVSSIASPVAPAPTCIDDPTYRRNKMESKNCDWIGRVDSRRVKLCGKKIVRSKCLKTCSNCCANDKEYTITTDAGENYKCWWIGRKLNRQTKYCSTVNNGSRVDSKCPKSCGLCGPDEGENSTSYPSASPTNNLPQSTLSSDQPSQVSSFAPSMGVTNNHSSEPSDAISSAFPSIESSYHPSSVPSLPPSLVPLPSKGPSFAPNENLSPTLAPFAALSLSNPSHSPSVRPSPYASTVPTVATLPPSIMQSAAPSEYPLFSPSIKISSSPSILHTSTKAIPKTSSPPSVGDSSQSPTKISASPSVSLHPSMSPSKSSSTSIRILMPSPVPSTMISTAPSVNPASIPPVTCSEDPKALFFLKFNINSPEKAIFQTCTWLRGRSTLLQSKHCTSTAAFGNIGPANTVCMETCGVCS